MTGLDALHEDWSVWNEEDGGPAVVAYRPDVFDSQAFPPACLPTLYLTRGPHSNRPRRPGGRSRPGAGWYVTLYLEPDVEYDEHPTFDDRATAIEGLVALAERFAEGEIDYRACYQHPRESYLDELDTLTGRAAVPEG